MEESAEAQTKPIVQDSNEPNEPSSQQNQNQENEPRDSQETEIGQKYFQDDRGDSEIGRDSEQSVVTQDIALQGHIGEPNTSQAPNRQQEESKAQPPNVQAEGRRATA